MTAKLDELERLAKRVIDAHKPTEAEYDEFCKATMPPPIVELIADIRTALQQQPVMVPTREKIKRAAISSFQFLELGHWERENGEDVFVTSQEELANLDHAGDVAADAVLDLFGLREGR